MSLFSELRYRNVFRVAVAYGAGVWLIMQVVETLFPIFGLTAVLLRLVPPLPDHRAKARVLGAITNRTSHPTSRP